MKSMLKRLLSSVLSVFTLVSAMPLTSVFAEDTKENYLYTLFASSDEEGAITIEANNFVINGEIATNGTVVCRDNNNVNASKNEQICAEMVYIPNKIEKDFFSGYSVEEIEGDFDLDEANINIGSPLSVGGVIELNGNINIQSGIKSKDDIILSGDVQNSSNTVIYSQYGNIAIDCNNVNINGLIYAPFGNVHINANNLNMNSIMIIADTITIEAPNVNVNYSEHFGKYFSDVSDKMEISEEDYQYFNDNNGNDIPDFFEKSINWKYLTDTDGDGVPDIIEINTGSDPDVAEDDYNEFLDSYTLELMYKNPLVLYQPKAQKFIIYGDMYRDQKIDVFDLVLLKRACINGEFYEEGDLDGDGDLDVDDVKYLQNFLLVRIKCYPVYDRFDTDNDGLSDYVEIQFTGTSSRLADTDGDGLSDYFEVYLSGTDPNVSEVNTSIDSDNDGLTMLQESKYRTNPYAADTDNDGLSDYDEVITYGTNPLNVDSDGDGLTDKEEVIDLKEHNLDPNNPATNGTPDGERILTQIIPANSPVLEDVNAEDNAYNLSLIVNASGNAATALSVEESGYSAAMKDGSAVGFIPEFFYNPEYSVQDITLKFEIKEEYRERVLDIFVEEYDDTYDEDFAGIKRFNIFKYFEEIDSVMPIDTEYDVENNTVYVTITSNDFEINDDGTSYGIGSYSLVDLEMWGVIMNENCADVEEEEETVQTSNALPQPMYAPHVNILEKGSQQVSESVLKRPMDMVAKIMRNYYAYAKVNTLETSASNVITYKGHKYSVINGTNISWDSAEEACEAMGGHLMTPSTAGEFALLQTVLTHGATYNHYWLGAYKNSSGWDFVNNEGSVKYIDTVRKNVEGYSYGLNDYGNYIGSYLYYADGMSYYHNQDISCSATGYICEWDSAAKFKKGVAMQASLAGKAAIRTLNGTFVLNEPLSKNNKIDTDGDGIPDYLELNWKLMNKVAPGATGVSWLQTYNWLTKNGTSKGIVSGSKTSDKVNKVINKTSPITTGSVTADTQPIIVTTAVVIDGRVISPDYDNDYYPDGDDPKPKKFTETKIDLGIIDDSEMFSKKLVLCTKDTHTTITTGQREIMNVSCGGGVTEIMKLPENCEKAAIKYARDNEHKVEFLIDNDSINCLVFEVVFDSAATADRILISDDFVELEDTFWIIGSAYREVTRERDKTRSNVIRYIIKADHEDKYYVRFDTDQCGSDFDVRVFEENYVYAKDGAIAFANAIEQNDIIYMNYNEIYINSDQMKQIVGYDSLIGGRSTELINRLICETMLYAFEDDYIDSREKISSINGNASTVFTYLGIPCLFLSGTADTIIGGAVTLLGAGTTSVSLGAGSYKNVFKDSLSSSIADCDYNIYLKTYDSAVSSSVFSDYIDPYGSAKWDNWTPGYICRIRGKSILDVATGLQIYGIADFDKVWGT